MASYGGLPSQTNVVTLASELALAAFQVIMFSKLLLKVVCLFIHANFRLKPGESIYR